MNWRNKDNSVKEISQLSNAELYEALELGQSRAYHNVLLISRYRSLRDKVNFYYYCVQNFIDIENFVNKMKLQAVELFKSRNVKLSSLGHSNFGELTLYQSESVLTKPIDIKLLNNNNAWRKVGFKDPTALRTNYGVRAALDKNGLESYDYINVLNVTSYAHITREQKDIIVKVCDTNIADLKLSYAEWKGRTEEIIAELNSRKLSFELTEDYTTRCSLSLI